MTLKRFAKNILKQYGKNLKAAETRQEFIQTFGRYGFETADKLILSVDDLEKIATGK